MRAADRLRLCSLLLATNPELTRENASALFPFAMPMADQVIE